jgi:hypothetical protein
MLRSSRSSCYLETLERSLDAAPHGAEVWTTMEVTSTEEAVSNGEDPGV